MEQHVIETVMRELLEEQKISNIKLEEISKQLASTEAQVKNFKDHLAQVRLVVPPINTLPMEATLTEHVGKFQTEIEQLKEFVTSERKKQRLQDQLLYWFGWILLSALFIILLVLSFKWNGNRF
jgi:hypothetical protein